MSTFSAQNFSRQFGQKYQQDSIAYVQDEDDDLPDDIDTSFASTVSLNSPSRDRHIFGAHRVNASCPQSSPHAMDICAPTPLDARYTRSAREFGRDVENDHEHPLIPSHPLLLFHKLSVPALSLASSATTSSAGSQSTASERTNGRSVLSTSWDHSSNQVTELHSAAADIPKFMVSIRPRSVSSLTDYQATTTSTENSRLRCGYDGPGFTLSSPSSHPVPPCRLCPSATTQLPRIPQQTLK